MEQNEKGGDFVIQSVPSTFNQLNLTLDLLLNLSHFFAKGGEQLSQTLGPLTHTIAAYVENNKQNQLSHDVACLDKFSKGNYDEFETMKYEFNRLFFGPISPKAPPYESVYCSPDRLVMQAQTLAVRKMYNQELLLSSGQGHEPDDFIGTELEFMAYLLARAVHADQEDKTTQAEYYLDFYTDFCNKHTNLWWKLFAQAIEDATTHPVFMAISKVLRTLTQPSIQ